MTLPQNLMRAMRIVVLEHDALQPEDAPAMDAAVEVLRGHVNRETGRAKVKRKVGGGTRRNEVPQQSRDVVAARSRGFCEVNALGCMGKAVHVHHRLMRSQGGGHEPENLLACCSPCHSFIHAQPAWSYERGYLLHAFGEETG